MSGRSIARRGPLSRATCVSHLGNIDIGEQQVAVAAERRSVDLLDAINAMRSRAKLCSTALAGWAGLAGWLAWLSCLPWQATLEALEGPNSHQKQKTHFDNEQTRLFGVLCWDTIYVYILVYIYVAICHLSSAQET